MSVDPGGAYAGMFQAFWTTLKFLVMRQINLWFTRIIEMAAFLDFQGIN